MDRPTGTITFLFTDIEGSTQLWERQPEAMKSALARHDALLKEAIEARGGYVFKTVGDAFCAAFASATDALEAALAAQRTLQAETWASEIGAIRIRAALHTGVAEEREGDYFGPPLNRVARLLAAGHGGQTLLSLATLELVRDNLPQKTTLFDLGNHRLKDLFRPERVYQLNAPDLPAEFPPLRTLDAKLTNLPAQPTPFIGRERELAAVLALLRREDVRLVTLTGPGGTGKTRLTLQTAADLIDEYEHGVTWVDLAPITDSDLVLPAIAGALGIKEMGDQPLVDTVKHGLRERQTLLVIDNFEQVITAAPLVGELLKAASRLKVMTSSREKLRVYGEHEYPVPPLGLPDTKKKQTVAVVSHYEAVALFIQRAKASHPAFEITDQNAPAVAEICVRLDGLPLAIELAAARSRMMTPQAMLEKLSSRLKALTGGARDLPARQQTLRSTIDWSYDLLENDEKKLFARLGVFQGGRSIEAAEAICGPSLGLDVTDGLESLLNKNLLRRVEGPKGAPRFVMLETIHEYAREKLRESGEADAIQRRHAEYFTTWVEWMAPELRVGPTQLERFEQLEEEQGNLRAVLEWSLGGADSEIGMRLVGAIFYFWWRQGYWGEWARWTADTRQHIESVSDAARAGALLAMSAMNFYVRRDLKASKQHAQEALALCRRLGNRRNTAWALFRVSISSYGAVDEYPAAVALVEEGITLLREEDDRASLAHGLDNLGILAAGQGDYRRAKAAFQESLDISIEIGERIREVYQYKNLGEIAQIEGDYDLSASLYKQSLTKALETENALLPLSPLAAMATLIGSRGQPQRAARLMGAVEALYEIMGANMQPMEQTGYDRGVALTREQLGEETFDGLRVEGHAMSLDEAIEYALQEGEGRD